MVSVPKPYVLGSETVRFWFGNRTVLVRKPYGFGTENIKRRLPETESKPFNHTLIRILQNKIDDASMVIHSYYPETDINIALRTVPHVI